MSNYQGNRPRPHGLLNIAPRPLPHGEECRLSYMEKAGFAACSCRGFGIFFCPSQEEATALWNERHMANGGVPTHA